MLHAHEHLYERSHSIGLGPGCRKVVVDSFNEACIRDGGADGRYRKGSGVVFVGVGTGGAALCDVNRKDPEAGYFAKAMGANQQPRWGFLSVRLTRTKLAATFVGTTPTSDFKDSFVIAGA